MQLHRMHLYRSSSALLLPPRVVWRVRPTRSAVRSLLRPLPCAHCISDGMLIASLIRCDPCCDPSPPLRVACRAKRSVAPRGRHGGGLLAPMQQAAYIMRRRIKWPLGVFPSGTMSSSPLMLNSCFLVIRRGCAKGLGCFAGGDSAGGGGDGDGDGVATQASRARAAARYGGTGGGDGARADGSRFIRATGR